MRITDIKINRIINSGTKFKAIVHITIDDMIVIHDIKVIQNGSDMFLAMPRKSIKPVGFKDVVHPISSDVRVALEKIIIYIYGIAVKNNYLSINVRMNVSREDDILTQKEDEFEIVDSLEEYEREDKFQIVSQKSKLSTISEQKVKKDNTDAFMKWIKM